jgi:glutathione S-transferase
MLLYNSQVSGNCYKVRLLFAQLAIAYERQELDVIDRSDRLRTIGALNPALRVPTPYLPEDRYERAQVLQWMFFEQYSHEPYIAVARFWRIAGIEPPAAELEAKQRGGTAALAALEGHLGQRTFLVAERYTVADIALYAYTHVAPEGGFQLEPYPAIRGWLERVAAQPGNVPITD